MTRMLARYGAIGLTVFALIGALFLYGNHVVRGSDHQDSPLTTTRPGTDISDMYVFPSPPHSAQNVVLAMNVHPIIPPGQGPRTYFDPGVLYQFKIDNTGDFVEDLVIQFKASGVGLNQKITLYGPSRPRAAGATNYLGNPIGTFTYNQLARFSNNRITVFAGPRQDPFFFDLAQFFRIIPDRNAMFHPPFRNGPPPPDAKSFRGFKGSTICNSTPAQDFLGAKDLNVLSLVIELPRAMLAKSGVLGKTNIWSTTSLAPSGDRYTQVERFARPAVKEVFTTYGSHDTLNRQIPSSGDREFKSMIYSFTTQVAKRSPAIANVLATVLSPYVMEVDLSQPGPAAYLGVETGGATGSKFGGRALKDDIIDISLQAIFGKTIPALKLAPDDRHESPCLETDNVGPGLHQFNSYFPYLGNPT